MSEVNEKVETSGSEALRRWSKIFKAAITADVLSSGVVSIHAQCVNDAATDMARIAVEMDGLQDKLKLAIGNQMSTDRNLLELLVDTTRDAAEREEDVDALVGGIAALIRIHERREL